MKSIKRIPGRHAYVPVPRFPAATLATWRSLWTKPCQPKRVERKEIRADGSSDLLRELKLFDLYRGDSIPPGTVEPRLFAGVFGGGSYAHGQRGG